VVDRAVGDASALDGLDELVAAGLLAETGEGRYAFVHALVLQTVYDDLGAARRQRLHRRTGEAIEAQTDAHAQVEALAHHFARSAADGQAAKAAAYALAAGVTAMSGLGYEEAAAHYRRGLEALELSPDGDGEVRCELLLGLGEALWSSGEMERARAAFLEAADLAERLDDASRLGRAALGFCGPPRFEPEQAYAESVSRLLERALAAPGADSTPQHARVTGRLAAALTFPGPAARRTELARTALAQARARGDKAALADVLASTYFATRGPDNLDARLHTLTELDRLADDLDDGRLATLVHYWRSLDLLELGDPAGMQEELEALERLAQTLGQRYPMWLAGACRARNAQLAGELESCEALAQRAFELGDEVGEAAMQVFGGQVVWVRREQGRVGELIEGVETVVAQFPELTAWRCGLGLFYAESGRPEDARRTLEGLAAQDFADIQRDVLWTLAMTLLADLVARLGVPHHAGPLYEVLAPFGDRCVVAESAVSLGSVARPLGVLATELGRFDAAERHFEAALERNEALGSPLWAARTRHDWAVMLRRRRAAGDRERAQALDERAREAAERQGLVALAREIDGLGQVEGVHAITR
jgi:tetratricopeptide (TPR) repeat protein